MNKERRKEIERAVALLQEAMEIVQMVGADEREAYENLSESLQGGERGEAMDAAATAAEEAESFIDEAISQLEQAAA